MKTISLPYQHGPRWVGGWQARCPDSWSPSGRHVGTRGSSAQRPLAEPQGRVRLDLTAAVVSRREPWQSWVGPARWVS